MFLVRNTDNFLKLINKIPPNLDHKSGSKTLSIGFSIVISIFVAFICEVEIRSLNQIEAIVATIVTAVISLCIRQ